MSPRVAMVVDRFPAEPFLARQVAALRRRGLDLHILCQILDRRAPAWALLDRHDLAGRIHPWPDRGRPLALALAVAGTAARALAHPGRLLAAADRERAADRAGSEVSLLGRLAYDARVLAVGADVVHFQFGDLARRRVHLAAAVDGGFSASFRGYDLTYAGLDVDGYYDRLWPVLDGAHTLGRDLQEVARRRGCPADMDWTVIPPAVDTEVFTPPVGNAEGQPDGPGRAGPLRILSVGRLHWKKGYADGLAAIRAVRDQGVDVAYRIIGHGPDEEAVRWQIADLGLDGVVELAGAVPPHLLPDELARADLFLHPALTEGFGNAVLEAQATALPVVCTDAEGLSENVVHQVTGLVVPRRRPDQLATALATLAADPDLRRRLGQAGRARVVEQFSLERQTDAYLRFFDQVNATAQSRSGRA